MSDWISVKDRLPEQKEHVLVYYAGDGKSQKSSMHLLEPDLDDNSKEDAESWNRGVLGITGRTLYQWHGFKVDKQQFITHWMPLPKPPGVDNE